MTAHLFDALSIRGVMLKNRVAISPMWQYFGVSGGPTDWHLMHYGRLAEGGAGLVIQEGTTVEMRGKGTTGDLGIWDDRLIPGLQRILGLVRQSGAIPGIQIMHPGGKARGRAPRAGQTYVEDHEVTDCDPADWYRMGPSGVPVDGAGSGPSRREMILADITRVQRAFVDAAARADQAGYEVVEIHGTHGYLIHTFLSEHTNKRADRYGGSFANRIRFLVEIVEGVRGVWPDRKPVFVRLSAVDGTSWTIEDTIELALVLKARRVDLIDCSSGGITSIIKTRPDQRPNGPSAYTHRAAYAGRIRDHDPSRRPDRARSPRQVHRRPWRGRHGGSRQRSTVQPQLGHRDGIQARRRPGPREAGRTAGLLAKEPDRRESPTSYPPRTTSTGSLRSRSHQSRDEDLMFRDSPIPGAYDLPRPECPSGRRRSLDRTANVHHSCRPDVRMT
jgi:2,4-dienoyl-CoA reductase-like NADH-dependent reductase (Old Yellow Enzyme family)